MIGALVAREVRRGFSGPAWLPAAFFLLAALLTAGAVAFAGGVSFVGLIAPHLARMLVGRARTAGIVTSILLGAIMLVGADLLVRVAFAPLEVPAGTVTAIIGAPYFLFLLMRKDNTNG